MFSVPNHVHTKQTRGVLVVGWDVGNVIEILQSVWLDRHTSPAIRQLEVDEGKLAVLVSLWLHKVATTLNLLLSALTC